MQGTLPLTLRNSSRSTLLATNLVYNRSKSYSSGVPGRSVNEVRDHFFVVDDPSIGVSMTPADHFIAGVAACAANHMELKAHKDGMPLRNLAVEIEARRDEADTSVFLGIDIAVMFTGIDDRQAGELVASYQGHCPLYKSVALATTVTITRKLA